MFVRTGRLKQKGVHSIRKCIFSKMTLSTADVMRNYCNNKRAMDGFCLQKMKTNRRIFLKRKKALLKAPLILFGYAVFLPRMLPNF